MDIRLKRIHDPADPEDGMRMLVDRLWPRGVRKADAGVDVWMRELAPSSELRRWFGHAPVRWRGFRQSYRSELAAVPEALDRVLTLARQQPVTLLFAARDRDHNQAVVLREVLLERAADGPRGQPASPTCYAGDFAAYNGLDREDP
ncbi:DUF488 domain-containing protein [Aquisalimonas sp.]|uniref:DUF488 domain-containing protein n=1 Tax=Aquisalimonas sp. TaxID=1872621 RepID=UPI0025C4FC09|nr:DUF488 domain-containing protein [Aquisalimonas sp.]